MSFQGWRNNNRLHLNLSANLFQIRSSDLLQCVWMFDEYFEENNQTLTKSIKSCHPDVSPCSVLGATVDIGPVFQQHLDNLSPASRGRLVESSVTGVIPPVDLPDVLLETVLNDILQRQTTRFRGLQESTRVSRSTRVNRWIFLTW